MKPVNNNEVDLLLRSLSRGRTAKPLGSGSTSIDGAQSDSDHLDADELNSYAEGVAPAPARARYTEHLADCEVCRTLVVGLIQVGGVANRQDVREQQRKLSFWQKLGTLFSPPVVRYAVPALILTGVIGIGLLALTQQRNTQLVARNEPGATAQPSIQPDAGMLSNNPGPQPRIQEGAQPGSNADSAKLKENLQRQKTGAGESPVTPAADRAEIPGKDSTQPIGGAGTAESRSYALEPKAAPPPPAPPVYAEKSSDLAKERVAKREDQLRDQVEGYRVNSNDVHGPNRSRSNTAPAANQPSGGLMSVRGPSAADKKKTGEVETRTVMGRHFTREGDAWVDTAYEPSRATVRLARGSDQFRALVADEPGIRTISEQLGGVVIVVWKGRAYRIQ